MSMRDSLATGSNLPADRGLLPGVPIFSQLFNIPASSREPLGRNPVRFPSELPNHRRQL